MWASYINSFYGGDPSEQQLLESAITIKVYLSRLIRCITEHEVCVIKYEELTCTPVVALSRVRSVLGLHEQVETCLKPVIKPEGIHSNLGIPVFNNIATHKRLVSRLLAMANSLFARESAQIGYEFSEAPCTSWRGWLLSVEKSVTERLSSENLSKPSQAWPYCPATKSRIFYEQAKSWLRNAI